MPAVGIVTSVTLSFLVLAAFADTKIATAEYNPLAWYRFENPADLSIDSSSEGTRRLDAPNCSAHVASYVQCPNFEAHGPVGGYITFEASMDASKKSFWGAKAPVNITSSWTAFTIEFLLKPGPRFLRGGATWLFTSIGSPGQPAIEVTVRPDALVFTAHTTGATAGGTPNDELTVEFTGQGVQAYDYLVSPSEFHSGWHHIALVKDAQSGNQSVWIDGVCSNTMHSMGNATGSHLTPTSGGITLNSRNAVGFDASVDEIALYDAALPGSLIFLHYQQTLNTSGKPGVPYSSADPGGTAPPPPLYPTTNDTCTATWCYWDLKEFPEGTVLPSPAGDNNTVGGDVPCVWQMEWFASPRYNTTAISKFGTPYNFNWMDPHYMAGATDPITKKFNVNLTIQLMDTMASRWRYGPMLWSLPRSHSTYVPSAAENLSFALFNAHPEWPMNAILPFGEEFRNQSLPKGCYLQNAAGEFITVSGEVTTSRKSLRPMSGSLAAQQGCPDTFWSRDGLEVASTLKALQPFLTRPFTILNLDGEVFVSLDTPAEDYNYSHDPTVLADFKSSGAPNWLTYWSEWRVRLTNAATDPYMTDPDLTGNLLKGTKLTMYQVQGTNGYFGNWTWTRHIMSQMSSGRGGAPQYFSTVDLYMPGPHDWWLGGGPNHGLQWLELTRKSELAVGDVFNSPFIAAGWSGKAEHNIRPAQWLGLVKVIAMWGAEFFYAGFFNVQTDSHNQMPVSGQWCWQGMMPSYAQAVLLTQAAEFFYAGEMVMADVNSTSAISGGASASPWLWAGQPNVVAVARKFDDAFLLTLAVQRYSNAALNLARPDVSVSLTVPGISRSLNVVARLQGSVYVFRNETGGSAPVLYQLDTWHQASHPSYWPTETVHVEAELFEGHLGRDSSVVIRTDLGPTALHTHDFRKFATYVDLSAAHSKGVNILYNLTHHGGVGNGDIRIRARAGTVNIVHCGQGGMAMGKKWQWVRFSGCNRIVEMNTLRLAGTAQVNDIIFPQRKLY